MNERHTKNFGKLLIKIKLRLQNLRKMGYSYISQSSHIQ